MKNFMAAALLGLALAHLAVANDKPQGQANTTSEAAMADGEVRRVDRDAKKLTIRHGPLQNLDMPAMTMVFQVGDPAMLDAVKVGDKVRFQAEKSGGAFTLIRIEKAL
jgi:Cu(I)/Ag(I) efflux system protein CusF